MYISTKIFDNYSVAIRQWKAQHSHCQLLHGYALEFKVWFASTTLVEEETVVDGKRVHSQLDDMNWIVDFGGFKDAPKGNGLKSWMDDMFDHTMLIEKDDPYADVLKGMEQLGIAKVHLMDRMGAESLAKLVFDKFNEVLSKTDGGRCRVVKVECNENKKNSAIYQSQII